MNRRPREKRRGSTCALSMPMMRSQYRLPTQPRALRACLRCKIKSLTTRAVCLCPACRKWSVQAQGGLDECVHPVEAPEREE